MAIDQVEVPLGKAATGERAYSIFIDAEAGAEARLAGELGRRHQGKVGLVTDENVAHLHLGRVRQALEAAGFSVAPVVLPAGEGTKSLQVVEALCSAMVRSGLDRRAWIMALGGGVVGDLGGFAASIFLRGVPYVQVPTTLLAQVDSSVGGKTGVNLPMGKNLVGTFHQPRFVYADLTMLETLPGRDLSSGLAEVVKHGAIADAQLFSELEKRAEEARSTKAQFLAELVKRSVVIKAGIVATDEQETAQFTGAEGGRARLNFGHTLGHALESASQASGEEGLRHGEAVGLGMIAAARWGVALGAGDAGLEERLVALLPRLGLPVDLDARLDRGLFRRLGLDKKREGEDLKIVVVDRVGSSRLVSSSARRLMEILLPQNGK